MTDLEKAITAIREALAEQPAKQRHIAYVCPQCYWTLEEQPAQQSAERGEPVAWRNAALRVGEDLCSVGPFGYYDMTAEQWLDWALSVVTVHAPPANANAGKPWVGLTDEEIGDIEITWEATQEWACFRYAARAIEAKLKEKNVK